MADVDLEQFDRANKASPFVANRALFSWLCDDAKRAQLYECMKGRPVLEFQSRAKFEKPLKFQQQAFLVTSRKLIEDVLNDPVKFSNSPYAALGSGTFMLGLDPTTPPPPDKDPHALQREFAEHALEPVKPYLGGLIAVAYYAASVLPLKTEEFNLAELAEQAAVRFVGLMFGYAASDHPILEQTMAKAFKGLNYQILGRHFVSEPAAIPEATAAMGALLARTAALIDNYAFGITKDLQKGYESAGMKGYTPVLRAMASVESQLSGSERAVVAVGLIAGIIGNIQSSVCTVIDEFFARTMLQEAEAAARKPAADKTLENLIMQVLRSHPPAAFLPRLAVNVEPLGNEQVHAGALLILAMGSAPRAEKSDADALSNDDLTFGGVDADLTHACLGRHIALPLITYIVRQVVLLPGLGRTKDPVTGDPRRLEKLWGFKCERLPLRYDRDRLLVQQPLNVIMKVKEPVSDNAAKLKQIIKYGAPQIEKKLKDARHVHFSWFIFLENDTKLALFTTYDGDFDAYIEHFALEIGVLFDKLFEHIEDAPPAPVSQFPKEFVETIRKYNQSPVQGYFFSAYPTQSVAAIQIGQDAINKSRQAASAKAAEAT